MLQKNREKIISLRKIYKDTLKDCGKNASKELIKQEFLFALKEIGEEFLKKLEEENEQNTNF